MFNEIAESLKNQIEERSKITSFKFKGVFNIGENLKLGVYTVDCVVLFDAIQLIKELKDKEELNQRERQRILTRVSQEHIYNVKVQYPDSQVKQGTLISEGGIYELIMLLESEEADKIRRTFALLIQQYRHQTGYTVEGFLRGAYDGKIIGVENVLDRRRDLPEEFKERFGNTPAKDICLNHFYQFYTVDDNIIFDSKESQDFLYDNRHKAELNLKLDYCINANLVAEALPQILSEDLVVLIQEFKYDGQLDLITLQGISKEKYFIGQQLFDFLDNRLYNCNHEKTKELFGKLLSLIIYNQAYDIMTDEVNFLVDSVSVFKDINQDTPIRRTEDYKKGLVYFK